MKRYKMITCGTGDINAVADENGTWVLYGNHVEALGAVQVHLNSSDEAAMAYAKKCDKLRGYLDTAVRERDTNAQKVVIEKAALLTMQAERDEARNELANYKRVDYHSQLMAARKELNGVRQTSERLVQQRDEAQKEADFFKFACRKADATIAELRAQIRNVDAQAAAYRISSDNYRKGYDRLSAKYDDLLKSVPCPTANSEALQAATIRERDTALRMVIELQEQLAGAEAIAANVKAHPERYMPARAFEDIDADRYRTMRTACTDKSVSIAAIVANDIGEHGVPGTFAEYDMMVDRVNNTYKGFKK